MRSFEVMGSEHLTSDHLRYKFKTLNYFYGMVKNYRIQVVGKVQGVWFRKYTQEAAVAYTLVGSVRNEKDGSVFVEAQGEEENLKSFIAWLYKGSPLSKVKEVTWEEGSLQHFTRFDISR